jgi:hypothetical protein
MEQHDPNMTSPHRWLIATLVTVVFSVSVQAQWTVVPDTTYGTAGYSDDITTRPRDSDNIAEQVFVTRDGTAYVTRTATTIDTSILVGRITTNGRSDQLYDLDGMVSIGAWRHGARFYLSPDQNMWYGEHIDKRYVLKEIDRSGQLRSTPIWQDTMTLTSNTILGIRPDSTLVMWSVTRRDSTFQYFIRYHKPGPGTYGNDIRVPFDVETVGISLFKAFMDPRGGLIGPDQTTDSTIEFIRCNETGVLDTSFGTANGRLVMEVPNPSFPELSHVRLLRNGDYVVVFLINPDFRTFDVPFVRMIRFDQEGRRVSTFGNNGILDFYGKSVISRGVVELPNGDLLFAVAGTVDTSLHYQIRPDGSFVQQGLSDYTSSAAKHLLRLMDDGLLYTVSPHPVSKHDVIAGLRIEPLTSVTERSPEPLSITVNHGVVSVKGATSPMTIRMYSIMGQCVFAQDCEPHGSVVLPSMVSGPYIVSVSTVHNSNSAIVYVGN